EVLVASRQSSSTMSSRARWWVVLAFLSPFVIGFCVFVLYPVAATLYYSLTDFQAGSYRPVQFVGLRNYRALFSQSDTFWVAVRNTLWMVVVMVPLRTAWAMFTAWSPPPCPPRATPSRCPARARCCCPGPRR
ncbi:hypothetical protein ABZ372_39935, partial [Streptomyces sp. NPDC005921]